jgi:inhibitor of Bruton tyrosine kinase
MSHLLWQYYWQNDVDKFRRQLASVGNAHHPVKNPAAGVGSPGAFGSSPRSSIKSRKASGFGAGPTGSKSSASNLTKAEVNSRDHAGLTILLRAALSASPNAVGFVEALLGHPTIDIYVQDAENGWNALHRALYAGNISIARLLLEKERRDLTESVGNTVTKVGQLIKTKDLEGNSPFDVYNATIALRTLKVAAEDCDSSEDESEADEGPRDDETRLVQCVQIPFPKHRH